jgi:diadenylate cyclase
MILRNGKVYAAGCILPLTANSELSQELGTRHRAAVGMSENSDAVIVVVSEETGNISIAVNGVLTRGYTGITLRQRLEIYLIDQDENENKKRLFGFIKRGGGNAE